MLYFLNFMKNVAFSWIFKDAAFTLKRRKYIGWDGEGFPFGHTVWQYKNGRRICGLLLHAPDDDGEGDVTIEEHST